jgi:hypothetical protein
MRRVVVLPAPLGPSRPVISPSRALKRHALDRLDHAGLGLELLVQVVDVDHGMGASWSLEFGVT